MVNGINNGSGTSVAAIREQLEALKQKKTEAETAQQSAESGKSSAEGTVDTSTTNVTTAKTVTEQATTQKSLAQTALDVAKQGVATATLECDSANSAVEGALIALESAKNADPPNETAIKSAQDAYDRAIERQKDAADALKAAQDAEEKAQKALDDATTALEKAESDQAAAEAALASAESALKEAVDKLEEAVKNLEDATKAVDETQAALDAAEASQPIMSEEQAINEGYTVIHSYDELLKVANDPSGKYILMGDIHIPEGVNWTPIGDANSPFSGTFDGNGCKIFGLNIDAEGKEAENIGFFGVADEATLSNITFVDAKVNGGTDYLTGATGVGILAGLIKNSTVDNCHVQGGEVSGYSSVGGLIGAVDDSDALSTISGGNSVITNCSTDVDVESMYFAGGLIGYVHSCDNRDEDHRGVVNKSLTVRNCQTSGSATAGEESVGGLIGETGKTLVLLDKCSSDMDLYWSNPEDDSDLSFLLETGRIGGLVGNINGTYITLANCEFDGSLNGDTEFQSEVYGWYMDDSHVCIYDLPAGLPVDDILNISGIDGMKLNADGKYECTVSTLAGLDKMVAMIKENPELADQVVFNVNFDFNVMDGAYTYSEYAQYGIVQHLYEDEDGNVHNDVYIDNECDLETTYHGGEMGSMNTTPCEKKCNNCQEIEPTMVPGLYKSGSASEGTQPDYFVQTDDGLKQVNLKINADDQITDVQTRLSESEVRFRERLVELGKKIQQNMRDILKRQFNWNADDQLPVITKAEYKKLLKKAEKEGYDSLSDKEKLSLAVFELDYDIMNLQAGYTKNLGCGMGGNASFLDKTKTYQMKDEQGRDLYTTLDGDQLIKDENGNYAYADGSGSYFGMAEVFEQRGYQDTDKDGNLLFSDADGKTVTQLKGEDGNLSYVTTNEDGEQIPYEGDTKALERKLSPANYSSDYSNFESDLEKLQQDVEAGKYPKERGAASSEEGKGTDDTNGADNTEGKEGTPATGDTDGDGDVDKNDEKKKPEDEV